jgi:hypothetical protein
MSYHDDLLEQARHLLALDPTRPRQVNLRRAVSAAYYALFHMLVSEASREFASDEKLRARIGRAFAHTEMKAASRSFAGTKLPDHVLEACASPATPIVPQTLQVLAKTFVDLQEARERADYDPLQKLSRNDARRLVERVERAFSLWDSIRSHPVSKVYLASLLLWKKWGRGGET